MAKVRTRWNSLGGYELVIDRQTPEGFDYTDSARSDDPGYNEAAAAAEEELMLSALEKERSEDEEEARKRGYRI